MRYFQIETAQQGDPEYVFLKDVPAGTEELEAALSGGEPVAADYPADAQLRMSSRSRGIVLPSVIGNVNQLLIVNRGIKDVLEGTKVPMECLAFTLRDRKGRVMSKDYFIVNPLGGFDCIDFAKSEIEYSRREPSIIIGIDKVVLDPKKVENAPDLFRVDRDPSRYVISERLGRKLQPLDPTNLVVHELEVSSGK